MLYPVPICCPECKKNFVIMRGGFVSTPITLQRIVCPHCGHELSMLEKLAQCAGR